MRTRVRRGRHTYLPPFHATVLGEQKDPNGPNRIQWTTGPRRSPAHHIQCVLHFGAFTGPLQDSDWPATRNGRPGGAQLAGPVLSWLCSTSQRPLRYVKVTPMTRGETR